MTQEILNDHLGPTFGNKSNYYFFIINESGCNACNKAFLDFTLKNAINKPNCIIYSTASGMRLDISPFLTDTIRNFIPGDADMLMKYQLQDASYFLYAKDLDPDTIIRMDTDALPGALSYISNLIHNAQ